MWVIIRLEGLPLSASTNDIRNFFYGLDIRPGGVRIIGGEKNNAFILFSTDEDARKAMLLTNNLLNGVAVQVLLSSRMEMKYELKQHKDQIEAISAINTSMSAVTATPKVVSKSTIKPLGNRGKHTALGNMPSDNDTNVQSDQGDAILNSVTTGFSFLCNMINIISQDLNVPTSHTERISKISNSEPFCEHSSAIGGTSQNTKFLTNYCQEKMHEEPSQSLDMVQKGTMCPYIPSATAVIHQHQDQNFRMLRQRPYDPQISTSRQRLSLHC